MLPLESLANVLYDPAQTSTNLPANLAFVRISAGASNCPVKSKIKFSKIDKLDKQYEEQINWIYSDFGAANWYPEVFKGAESYSEGKISRFRFRLTTVPYSGQHRAKKEEVRI